MRFIQIFAMMMAVLLLMACGDNQTAGSDDAATPTVEPTVSEQAAADSADEEGLPVADVVSVQVSGEAGNYQFAVEISSPDTGCEQYAVWWEVLSESGELQYRRVLLHSHVNEQPFTRSGGAVDIQPDEVVWVRAYMQPTGYGGLAFRGTVNDGFQSAELAAEFAADVATLDPQPLGCAW